MRLNDPLVTEIRVNDATYPIDLSFDTVLDVFDYLEDPELLTLEKMELALSVLLGNWAVEDTLLIWEEIFTSYLLLGNSEETELDLEGNPLPAQKGKKLVDIEQDAEYIYASFLQTYNINLFQQQGKMSWMEFRALLNALPEDTIMQEIISIRQWEPDKNDSKEQKAKMKKLQKKFKLIDKGGE